MLFMDQLVTQAQQNHAPQPKALAISGSPRKGGNTDIIVKRILAGFESDIKESVFINLNTLKLQGCIGCEKCRKDKVCTMLNDGMSLLYPDILESQALILASPVHNYNITAWMKAFIDRMYCFYEFDNNTRPRQWYSRLAMQNRKVVIAAICEQEHKEDMGFALEAMQKPMEALGYHIVGTLPVFQAFEKGAVKKQDEVLQKAYELGSQLRRAL